MKILSPDELAAALKQIGAERYHNLHPFHRRLHSGQCTIDEVRAWALNRYCYQRIIPFKDAAILARMDDVELRRIWRQRIIDHDGEIGDAPEGGLRRWLALTDGLGFTRAYVQSMEGALPAVRFACDAYVHFVAERTLLEAIASSLTELFSPQIISERVSGMLKHYDFVDESVLRYFGHRLSEAPRDAEFALDYVCTHARTPETQRAALKALEFKCGMLWAQLDAIEHVYVNDNPCPGAWRPGIGMAD
ncbi:pyrroloquinoline quinone biosynthesis protein PqqC [Stappia sp. 22II-S9-Z10]|nr:pyrroloquinoline quinone biosynthesis protein PqqC [Stappia sp. 22II-S9-Z10]